MPVQVLIVLLEDFLLVVRRQLLQQLVLSIVHMKMWFVMLGVIAENHFDNNIEKSA